MLLISMEHNVKVYGKCDLITKIFNMKTQDWINEQKIEAVQDRKDGKDYWKHDNLYTETDLIELLEAFAIYSVSNSAPSMEDILNEAQRRKAKHSVQYSDYSLDTWTVANDLLEQRKNALLADGSVRKVRIEYEM